MAVALLRGLSALLVVCASLPPGRSQEPKPKSGEVQALPADAAKELLQKGPFQLRALEPSERPTVASLTDPKRFAALRDAQSASLFAARGERESFAAVVLGLNGQALTAKATDLEGPSGARIPAVG
jgi:hypothetical protein